MWHIRAGVGSKDGKNSQFGDFDKFPLIEIQRQAVCVFCEAFSFSHISLPSWQIPPKGYENSCSTHPRLEAKFGESGET